MKKVYYFVGFLILLFNFSCENNANEIELIDDNIDIDLPIDSPIDTTKNKKNFKILSLGDSYTIGESVCETCRFPEQLKDSLLLKFERDTTISVKVIARTGWTTGSLIGAIRAENLSTDYDLVTLLIGVNNQFTSINFSVYETEFPALVSSAIKAVNDNKNKLIVVSIPDYAFTPLVGGNTAISNDIDKYNEFAKKYCDENEITFVNITEITRQGLVDKSLVASDDLHPSEIAYSKFVSKMLPFAFEKIK